jgi:hypothetical protein
LLVIRYLAAAAALKGFSVPVADRGYRVLANRVGARRRTQGGFERGWYLPRARTMVERARRFGFDRPDARIVEIGTGWVHWEATVVYVAFGCPPTLFDVVDNRQLPAYRSYLAQLRPHLDTLGLSAEEAEAARGRLDALVACETFAEIYASTGMRYETEPAGTLATLPRRSFDVAVSHCVLEHVRRATVPTFLRNLAGLLVPGGVSIHQFDLTDHLHYYDPATHPKTYLRFSDRAWRIAFENEVQYINRIQRPEWLARFDEAGFDLVEDDPSGVPMDGLAVHRQYAGIGHDDLGCTAMRVVHAARPGGGARRRPGSRRRDQEPVRL